MRHGIAGNKLNRNQSLRKATIRDIAKATLIQQRICTTKAKAKEARKLVDRLITLGKKGTLAHKRRAFAILCDHKLVSDLFNNTSPRFKNRVGGYTRMIPLGNRRGDNAQLAYLELTEKSEVVISQPKSSASKSSADVKAKESTKSKTKKSDQKEPKDSIKDSPKTDPKKPAGGKEKGKGKNIVGGIRKMFNRKAPGGK